MGNTGVRGGGLRPTETRKNRKLETTQTPNPDTKAPSPEGNNRNSKRDNHYNQMGAAGGVVANDSEAGREENVASASPARRHLDDGREQFPGHDTRPAARSPHEVHKNTRVQWKIRTLVSDH